MTQEDKELLLKDLCARLPYGVKVESVFINPDTKEHKSCGIEVFDATSILMIRDGLGEFKPYLFSLSSMTEAQKKEINKRYINSIDDYSISIRRHSDGYWDDDTDTGFSDYLWIIDWFNKNHFDYQGLIKKGLAIDATDKKIY